MQMIQGGSGRQPSPGGSPNEASFSPNYEPKEIFEIAKRLMKNM